MNVSKIALAVALAVGGGSLVAVDVANAQIPGRQQRESRQREQAQPQQQAQQAQPGQRQLTLTREERAALVPVQTAIEAQDWAAAQAALAAAQAAAQGADARYMLGALQLRMGIGTSNQQVQAQAIDAMIASGGAPAEQLPQLLTNQAALAVQANDYRKAEAAYTRLVELQPNNHENLARLAEVKNSLNKPNEAVALIDRAIQAMRASGQQVPENWYKRGLKIAYDGRMPAQATGFARALIAAYPTRENWRDSLLIYRETAQLDRAGTLDLLRLQRAANALAGERDYFEMAELLNQAGLPGEANAVLEAGIQSRMIDGNRPAFRDLRGVIQGRMQGDRAALAGQERQALAAANGTLALNIGDAYYGYGDYAKAATLYRAALQKGGVDANVVNTRLGMALHAAGQRVEAEAAFRAVTGPRQELANFWLALLAQRA
jgi:tetratricopeptide (TPR) repeat protein